MIRGRPVFGVYIEPGYRQIELARKSTYNSPSLHADVRAADRPKGPRQKLVCGFFWGGGGNRGGGYKGPSLFSY